MNQEELLKDVEIVEPPMQEFRKRGHWFATACLSGSGCVLLFIASIVIGIKFYIGAGPATVKNLPTNFPTDVPIYDQYNIDKITYISGRYKSRSMEMATFFPKLVLSPVISREQNAPSTSAKENGNIFKEVFRMILKPIGDSRDMIQVEWRDITSDVNTMITYYKRNLTTNGFTIESETQGNNYRQLTFSRQDNLSGTIFAEFSDQKTKKVTYAFIMVNLPYPAEVVSTNTQTLTTTTSTEPESNDTL
ncbi:MAG: hypothetical protein WC457_02940 [Patescibacteria group bacterium]